MDNLAMLHEGRRSLLAIRTIVKAREEQRSGRTPRDDVDEHITKVYAMLAEALDDHHHAPMCGANHYHGARCPSSVCTCGAWKHRVRMMNHPALGRTGS